MWKICTKCGKHKALWAFHKGDKEFSTTTYCSCCRNKHNREYKLINREIILLKNKQYKKCNRDIILQKQALYRLKNKEILREKDKQYSKLNKDKNCVKSSRYRLRKLKQTPVLTPQQQQDIDLYYALANYLSEFGTPYEVDHIIPVAKGGLQHPDNLQVLTQRDNRAKGAKLNYKYKDEVFSLKV